MGTVCLRLPLKMHDVFVKADAETYQLQLEQAATVGDLRKEIESWTYAPPEKQELYFLACPVTDDTLKIGEIIKPSFGNAGNTFHLGLPTAGEVRLSSDINAFLLIGNQHNFVSKRLTKTHGECIKINISNKRMAIVFHDETENDTVKTNLHVQVYKEQKDKDNKARYQLKGKTDEDGTQQFDMLFSKEFEEDGSLKNPITLKGRKQIYKQSTNKFDIFINKMVTVMNYITGVTDDWIGGGDEEEEGDVILTED